MIRLGPFELTVVEWFAIGLVIVIIGLAIWSAAT